MNTCIQNYTPVKKGVANPILTIRLNDAEFVRFQRLMEIAKSRNPYAGKSDVLRELLSLNRPEVLTTAEIHFFRTGEKKGDAVKTLTGLPFAGVAKAEEDKKRKTG